MMYGPLLALSFSLVAAQPALRGAGAGTRALLFSNFVGTDVETVAPTAEQRGSGFCYTGSNGNAECDVSEPDCSGETDQWFPPGHVGNSGTECCMCESDCDHSLELTSGENLVDCDSLYYD